MSKTENKIPDQNNINNSPLESKTIQQPVVLTDADINPFLTEAQRKDILAGKAQDPEWD